VGVTQSGGCETAEARGHAREPTAAFLLEQSKLDPPPARPGSVRRAALLQRLLASPAPVLSLAAPPGYGKSALLAQWAEETPARVAWLSLEHEDNDPAVLLAYVAATLGRLGPIDPTVFRSRVTPGTSVAVIVARRVSATLAAMDGPVALVLDHAEVLHRRQCRDAVAELALHLPSNARLAVASRGTPPVPLARLLSRGAVVELGQRDLAMGPDEARSLLDGAGATLTDEHVLDLVERTEGWPAGLHLAALAAGDGNPHRAADLTFTGDDRLMADYLRSEVLAGVPRGRLTFLTRTSVLERMNGPLCDAVIESTRSGRLLEALESSDMLVVPLDRRREWYRYHTLFRQLLRSELDRREGDVMATRLHARAATWFEANGTPDMAIAHARSAGDADQVARLVGAHLLAAYAGGRLETVREWCAWFDDQELVDRYPAVAVLGAVLRALNGEPGGAERWAAAAERAPDGDEPMPDGSTFESWRAMLRAFLCRHGPEAMRRDAAVAGDDLAPGSRWRPGARMLEGIGWLLDGDVDRADPILARAAHGAEDIGASPAVAASLAERSVVAMARGDWPDAAALAARGLTVIRDGQLEHYGPSILTYAVAARIAAHGGDLARAQTHLADAARLRAQLSYALPFLGVQTLLELARTYLALADPQGARVVLREARDILRVRPDLGRLGRDADDLDSTLETLRVGEVGVSSLTAAELRLVPYLATHLTFREIGERLHISRHTVKSQAISTYRKLGVSSRSEAIDRFESIGLLGG
jgi:LuxR family maltose regulon positive regulatory protein